MKFWNKKDRQEESTPSLSEVFAETVVRHYPASTADGHAVALGDTGIRIRCEAGEPQHMGDSLLTVALYLQISGGPFGPEPSFASISGYAPWGDTYDLVGQSVCAVTEGGCVWTCTLLEVLEAAGLVTPRESCGQRREVTGRPAQIGGRRYQVWSSRIDRTLHLRKPGPPDLAVTRARLGGDSTMTSAVLSTDSLPVHASDHALLLSTFAMTTDPVTAEVKVHGGDWPPSCPPLTAVESCADGITMLRELAVAVPVDPARWDRGRLAATLAAVGEHRTEPHQAAGWREWRQHGGQLLAPLTDAQITAAGVEPASLPADYHRFLTQVGWGAGPGYGLLPPTLSDLGLVLAKAGDQVSWYLAPSGGVWADTRTFDLDPVQTHDSFDAWYADWLDNAVAGLRPWQQWEGACASVNVLSQMLEDRDRRGIEGGFEGVKIAIADVDGQPVDPCHNCQTTFARFGMGDEVWVTGAAKDRGGR